MKGLAKHEIVEGYQVFRIPSLRRSPYKASIWAMAGYIAAGIPAGYQHIHSWKPDIIHVHFAVPSGPAAWFLSKTTGTPYVLTAHLGDIPGGVPEKTSGWFRWIYPFTHRIWRDASRVVAVSEFSRKLALNHYPVQIEVIPNGVNLQALDPGEIKTGQPPRIVFAGRFMPQKNPLNLVRVLFQMKDLDWNCTMLGDGSLKNEVESIIHHNQLNDRFSLPGWVKPEEVIQYFNNSDILFMPSSSEGLPVVGVQALAMGLAIIASRVGGFVDVVDEGVNGFLYSPEDLSGMQTGLQFLINNPDTLLEYRKQSRRLASKFDLSIVIDGYERIFYETIAA
jgi:glycosyltransferase involved in cell wall biosynthesis